MKLLITHAKLPKSNRYLIADSQRLKLIDSENFDGLSTQQIKNKLKLYKEDEQHFNHVLITADSRLLMFVDDDIFKIRDVLIRRLTGGVVPIQQATTKELRIAHNLMKMYDAGAFTLR